MTDGQSCDKKGGWTKASPARALPLTNSASSAARSRSSPIRSAIANPIYRDPAAAAQAGFAGIPAPPTLLRTFLYETSESRNALGVKDWSYIVHGEQEFEYLAPVVAGDVLSAQDRIVSIAEKESKRAGTLQIAVIETVFKNQRGETVQIARRTLVETGKRISE